MPNAALMLMVHHAILNQDLHKKKWHEYFHQQEKSEGMSSQILASHVIWLTALLPLQVYSNLVMQN
jgi:ABC-type transporter Mla maintaining outer membrane lipid asymmetry permease subunit MlaE